MWLFLACKTKKHLDCHRFFEAFLPQWDIRRESSGTSPTYYCEITLFGDHQWYSTIVGIWILLDIQWYPKWYQPWFSYLAPTIKKNPRAREWQHTSTYSSEKPRLSSPRKIRIKLVGQHHRNPQIFSSKMEMATLVAFVHFKLLGNFHHQLKWCFNDLYIYIHTYISWSRATAKLLIHF